MALVQLPRYPAPETVEWELQDFGGNMQGATGGSSQRVNRLGNRWTVTVQMPVMTLTQARQWSALLLRGLRNGVIWRVRQPGLMTGMPGAPVVDGAGQAGDSLNVTGLTGGYILQAGQRFSLITGARRYIYAAAEAIRLDANGEGMVELDPPLRAEPADGDVIEIGLPMLQGILGGLPPKLETPSNLAGGFSFTIAEQR